MIHGRGGGGAGIHQRRERLVRMGFVRAQPHAFGGEAEEVLGDIDADLSGETYSRRVLSL
jgi:hypothetical protein